MKFIHKNIRRLKYYLALAKANSYFTSDSKTTFNSVIKHICFELDIIDYHRYFYVLVLFYRRAGYNVFIKANKKSVARIMLDKYAQKLLEDSEVFFVKAFPQTMSGNHNLVNLQATYFEKDASKFYVPMCQHPTMYDRNIDTVQFETERVNSIGFAGDFREHLYGKSTLKKDFNHLNRIEMLEALQQQTDKVILLESDQNKLLKEHSIYIADNTIVRFEPNDYRNFLSRFNFFLSLPGIHMPISHNIIEAMSLGTIPFIHKSYSEHMHPPLEHMKTAFIFNDFNSLYENISELFLIENSKIEEMRKETFKYYENYLSSKAVIQNLEAHNGSDYKLIAEWNSVSLNSKAS